MKFGVSNFMSSSSLSMEVKPFAILSNIKKHLLVLLFRELVTFLDLQLQNARFCSGVTLTKKTTVVCFHQFTPFFGGGKYSKI